ncbi:hypothetical protein [Frankia tisae]|uniref:hypothetical protein n=1 Tax=Frankia tisae TaxID=2950104 RepID=UPI0021C05C82|nr:hypothetical protein [Frankia tisae]
MTAVCSVCEASTRLRKDGGVFFHDIALGERCPGSGNPPLRDDPPLDESAEPDDSQYPPAETVCRRCDVPADPSISQIAGWCSSGCRDAGRAAYRQRRADMSRRRRGVTTPWRRTPSRTGAQP